MTSRISGGPPDRETAQSADGDLGRWIDRTGQLRLAVGVPPQGPGAEPAGFGRRWGRAVLGGVGEGPTGAEVDQGLVLGGVVPAVHADRHTPGPGCRREQVEVEPGGDPLLVRGEWQSVGPDRAEGVEPGAGELVLDERVDLAVEAGDALDDADL